MSSAPKVLLVDDRPDSLLALELQLGDVGAELLKASSGHQALDLLLEHEVALAILDVQMPEMDGFELAELMRGSPRTRTIPLIFITAGLHDRSRVFAGYDAGAVDFLIKPVEPRVLASKVRVFLQLYRQNQALAERVRELETAQAALRESAEQSRRQLAEIQAIYDSAHVGLCAFDRDLRFLRINHRLAEINGVPAAEHVGKTVEEVVPSLADAARAIAERILATGEGMTDIEFTGETSAQPGVQRTWVEQWLPLKGPSGEVVGINVVAEEVTERRRTQAALQEVELRYRDLFNAMIEGFAVHEIICDEQGEPIDFRYLEMNPAFERLTGLGREILGKRHNEVLPDDDPKWVQIYGKVALTGEPLAFENYSPALERWYEVVAFSPGHGRFATLFSDVTERRRAEHALRESEARFRSVLEGAQDLIYRRNLRNQCYEYISPSAEQVTGYLPGELATLGASVAQPLVHPQDRELVEAGLARLEHEGHAHLEYRFRTKGGEYRWMWNQMSLVRDRQGQPLYRDGTLRDITQRKLMEEALRESEARFRQLAETVPQLVFEVSADGKDEYLNDRWREYTGRPIDLETRVAVVHPEDREAMNAAWRAAVETGRQFECECRFRRHDGQYRWLLARAQPFTDESGAIRRWFGTATDIHDLKLAQEALREVDQRRTDFLAVLSHELRNPLAPIKNSLYILDHAAPGGEQAARAKEVIGRQVDHLAHLVNDLLDVTRISRNKVRLQKERLDLNEAVRRTVEDNRSLFERNQVRLELALSPTNIAVLADRTRIAQVVSNLLQNAAKFTRAGGWTRVTVETTGERAKVRVADSGVGMSTTTLERLFQPFAQAAQSLDRSAGGLGLGLALVKGLVELHGGGVSARSDGLGKGAEFVVELPCSLASGVTVTPVPVSEARGGCRVLIIEDNPDAAESLREVLEIYDHLTAVAHHGVEGLRVAQEFRPDVVLCDIGLPGMDGYEVARALRADPDLASLHLVALSGYALPDDLKRSHEAGFDLHMAKPPSLKKLQELFASLPANRATGSDPRATG